VKDGLRPLSPKRIVQQRLTALLKNENTGIRRLKLLLLFAGENDANIVSGKRRKSSKLNYNLSRDFLPPAPSVQALKVCP
jgi:hypothetical protein